MGVLDRFEKGIERAVNGAFAKAFRSEVQPVEIASALRRECDDKATIVGRDHTLAPNSFVVELGVADHERLAEIEEALASELGAVISDHASQQRYSLAGPVSIAFEQAEDLDTGLFRVRSRTARGDVPSGRRAAGPPEYDRAAGPPEYDRAAGPPEYDSPAAQAAAPPIFAPPPPSPRVGAPLAPPSYPPQADYPPPAAPPPAPPAPPHDAPHHQAAPHQAPQHQAAPHDAAPHARPNRPPVLDVAGHRFPIVKPITVIGRGSEADLVLDDTGVSRRHAEVHHAGDVTRIIDLGSTNGTFVDGVKRTSATLHRGSVITIGRTKLTFGPAEDAG